MNFLKKTESGFAQLVVLGVMALMAVALPLTTNLVKQNQENRSKAAEGATMSCNVLRDTSKKYFEVCADFDNVCFNKHTGEYQGCGNINGSNGGDCTDPEHNTNANNNMLCPVKSDISLSCDTLYNKKQKYFAMCAGSGGTGACFDKQTGESKGCVNNNGNNCSDSAYILCPVKSDDLALWDNAAGKCGAAYGKTFEKTPTVDLCQNGEFSRAWFDASNSRYYWKCGNVEKYGNEAANCFAVVTGVPGSARIILDKSEVSLGIGQSMRVNAKLDPAGSSETIVWSSDMPDFFSVDQTGLITMLKTSASGDVTAMTLNGHGVSIRVNTSVYTEKTDGVCGSANGKTFTSIPDNNLCTTSVNSHGQMVGNRYIWTCMGANGGFSSDCWANVNTFSVVTTPTPISSNPYLFLRVDKKVYSVGQTFTVIAGVNSTTNKIGGVDAVINYKTDVLSLISVKKSPSFVFKNSDDDCVINKNFVNGKVVFTCFVGNSINDKAVDGDLVILTFAVNHAGVSDIAFECKPGEISDSNIVVDSKDVIDCSRNINQKISTNNSGASNSPRCGLSGTYKTAPSRDSLCEVGTPTSVLVNRTTMVYSWKCVVGNETKSCSARPEKGGTVTPTPMDLITSTPEVNVISGKPYSSTTASCKAKDGICATYSKSLLNGSECKVDGYDFVGKVKTGLCPGNTKTVCCTNVRDSRITPTPISIENPCVLKEGVNSFSVDTECDSGKFRYMTFTCYDGYTRREGGPTSCKDSNLWRTYADGYCKGHFNNCRVNGKCGNTRNNCVTGKVDDEALPDTTNSYRWKCLGNNGGKNVNCSMSKKVNGKCGTERNICINGTVSSAASSDTKYTWRCVGKYGGKTVSCSIRK